MGIKLDDETTFLNALYYGLPGSTKTTSMASLANVGPIVYVDFESGLKARALKNRGINTDNIIVERPQNYKQLEALYWDLKGQVEDGGPNAPIGVVFDSYTELQAMLVGEAVGNRVLKAEASGKTGEVADEFFTDRNDYGTWTAQARKLTRMFRDLPIHTAFGALLKTDVDANSGVLTRVPQLTAAFRNDIMGYVDVICATVANAEQDEYLGIFRTVRTYQGKDRLDFTPPVLATPTFDRLLALFNGELDLATDPAQVAYVTRVAKAKAERDAAQAALDAKKAGK